MGRKPKAKNEPQKWEHNPLYRNQRGNIGDKHYLRMYDSMLYSPAFRCLSGTGSKLYLILRSQYRDLPAQTGGTIKCPYRYLLSNGFNSADTLSNAFLELEAYGFIEVKLSGGHNIPNEYRLSDKWIAISEEEGKQIKRHIKETRKSKHMHGNI